MRQLNRQRADLTQDRLVKLTSCLGCRRQHLGWVPVFLALFGMRSIRLIQLTGHKNKKESPE